VRCPKHIVPISRTRLRQEDVDSVVGVLQSGWLVQGAKVREFEEKWEAYTGAKHAIAVTSGTSALHLSLAALGFGSGDEAIVPAFTWVSTANVVEHLGGRVVFCDIDLSTFNLDVENATSKISERTKVIIPVHLFGLPADISNLTKLAAEHGLKAVEDAACGFGSRFQGKHVGTFGDTGCFSFHPRKAITTGEGGMITTGNDNLAEKLRSLRDHGAIKTDLQRHLGARPYLLSDHIHAGYNQRMTDLQAALGSSQMDRSQAIFSEKQKLASVYDRAFADIPWLKTPQYPADSAHSYQSYVCLFQPEPLQQDAVARISKKRNEWMERLQKAGISTRPGTHAVHMLGFYREKYGHSPDEYPNAWIANDCSIALPLFSGMTASEQDYVIENVLKAEI